MKSYGKCPVCKRWIRITNLEKLFKHGADDKKVWPPVSCAGWGQDPEQIESYLTPQEAQFLNKGADESYVRRGRLQRKGD